MPLINISPKEQPGGYKFIQIITIDEIVNCPEFLTNRNALQFISSPNSETIDVIFIDDNLKITEKQSRTASGILYTINCQIDIADQSSDLDDFLQKRVFKNILLIAEKTYNQKKLYGSKNAPLKMSFEQINGKTPEEGSITRLRITGKIVQKPVFIQG